MTTVSNNRPSDDAFFKYLSVCPLEKVQALLNHLIDVFCGQKTSFMIYRDIYKILEWWDIINASTLFFIKFLGESSVAEFNLAPLSVEYQDLLKNVLDVRSTDLKKSLAEKTYAVSPENWNSLDWRLKMTLASDKVAQINGRISSREIMKLNLNKEEFKALIDAMEIAEPAVLDLVDD